MVATRRRTRGAALPTDADTVVLNNIKKKDISEVLTDLTSEGYTVTVKAEPDGEFTVIGVKTS